MDRKELVNLVKKNVDTENLRKHMFAVSAIMKRLGKHLQKDKEKWWKVGLLHDIDYEETKDNPEIHGKKSAQMVEKKLSDDALRAIKAHNFQHLSVEPESDLEHALIAADAISGLIIATALVMPNKKIQEVRVESVLKKFDDSSFASNIDRERILYCEKIGLSKEKFIELSLNALKKINEKLGL